MFVFCFEVLHSRPFPRIYPLHWCIEDLGVAWKKGGSVALFRECFLVSFGVLFAGH